MNKEEKVMEKAEDKRGRRKFFKYISKYLLGFCTFTIASLFGLKRRGEIRLGKMKDTGFGLSEAHGTCSFGATCAGGGGECSYGATCAGGGGVCSFGATCAGD